MATTTTDHEAIRKWVEERGGHPARVDATGRSGNPGVLRIEFSGEGKGKLKRIEWDEFFQWFDRDQLAFIYQDRARGGRPSRFNKLVSRARVGDGHGGQKQGGAKRGAAPAQDAIELLTSQHRMVEEMFEQLEAERPGSAEYRRLFADLADALAVHSTIEEQVFYPGVKREETEGLLENSVEEHLEVKRVLATLMETAPDGDARGELEELAGLTEEHVIEEEHELFPQVRKLLAADELRDLARRMTELEAELRREGEPRAEVPNETDEPAPI
jgi:iron-sulfur cluster repair protein YtfE (RIC family)